MRGDRVEALDGIGDVLLSHLPETAVYSGIPEALSGGPLARRSDDWSPCGIDAYYRAAADCLNRIEHLPHHPDAVSALQTDAVSVIFRKVTRTQSIRYGRNNPLWFSGHVPYVITPVAGPHIDSLNVMADRQSLDGSAALEALIQKLEGFAETIEQWHEKLVFDEAEGCRPPSILSANALPILDAFIHGDVIDSRIYRSLASRTSNGRFHRAARTRLLENAATIIERRMRPAMQGLRTRVAEMVLRGRSEAGVWAQPRGEELYRANVQALGETDASPEEIHRIGIEQARQTAAAMDAQLGMLGFTRGSVGERMTLLRQQQEFHFRHDDEGRADALAYARDLVRGAEGLYARILPPDLEVRAKLEVRRMPQASEAGAPGGFSDPPSLDGQLPGNYWLNLRDMALATRVTLPTLSYHEAVPGHFTARAIATGLGKWPLLLKVANFNGYNEGWALYAERLMSELGAYADNPAGDLGRLQQELFRAARLIVDTGIHQFRWSRDYAIDYMIELTGEPRTLVTSEVERYMAWPGQALGYKLGQLRFLELRDKMKEALGEKFDVREFHRALLAAGNLPVELVAREVNRAIMTSKRGMS